MLIVGGVVAKHKRICCIQDTEQGREQKKEREYKQGHKENSLHFSHIRL